MGIAGGNFTGTYGIFTNQTNTTIRNCNISSFSEGIRFSGANDSLAQNNTISITFNGGNGTHITAGSHRDILLQNTIANGNASGIYIDGGNNTTVDCFGMGISGGNFSNTYGIYSNQFNTTIRNCNIGNFNTGILFDAAKNGTIVNNSISTSINNMVTPLWSSALVLQNGASFNTLANNNASATVGRAIYFSASTYNTITNCTGSSISIAGIHIENGANYNAIANSTGISSAGYGIEIFGSINNTINGSTARNLVSGAAGYGLYISSGSHNTWITNTSASSNISSAI